MEFVAPIGILFIGFQFLLHSQTINVRIVKVVCIVSIAYTHITPKWYYVCCRGLCTSLYVLYLRMKWEKRGWDDIYTTCLLTCVSWCTVIMGAHMVNASPTNESVKLQTPWPKRQMYELQFKCTIAQCSRRFTALLLFLF